MPVKRGRRLGRDTALVILAVFLASVLLTALIRKLATSHGLLDCPTPADPTPRPRRAAVALPSC
jgi:hypothetical protein